MKRKDTTELSARNRGSSSSPGNPRAPAAQEPTIPLDDPSLYFNRELSFLEFNRRVLSQARDQENPLLERLRFLTISSTNLDEFFEVRVAGLRQQVDLKLARSGADGLGPLETLRRVSAAAHELVAEQYRVLQEEIFPALEAEKIRMWFRLQWTEAIRAWVRAYWEHEVLPVLTPIGLDPAHPFPTLVNKSLNFIVSLEGRDAFGRSSRMAVLQAPRILPRMIALPDSAVGAPHQFVTLSGVIHDNVERLFPGMKVLSCSPFRVTRNSELWVDEEETDDLLLALKGELPHRPFGAAVRLEVGRHTPSEAVRMLLEQFRLDEEDLYQVQGPVNLHRLAALHDLVDRPDLKFKPFTPAAPKGYSTETDCFEWLRSGEILLHHPFQAFGPVIDLLQQAAEDPDVLAIKITLYRTGEASPLTDALVEAARNGKEVTAVVELRARFDEAANIDIATRLQEVGAKVVYGIVGFKAHAKMLMIVRREKGRLRRYVHLGTGNYHLRNTRYYTDFGLLTCDDAIGEDVHNVFQQLTGLGKASHPRKLAQAPFLLHGRILDLIQDEIENAQAGKPARIRAKINALIEPGVIRALYRASRAGVKVELVVRGVCCLKPGVPGVSENITVRSIVGRFLEHSRVYDFRAAGRDVVYCASADWAPRNFFRRVEAAFPLERPELKRRAVEEGLDVYLADNTQAWTLRPDGKYTRLEPGEDPPRCAQTELLERLTHKHPHADDEEPAPEG